VRIRNYAGRIIEGIAASSTDDLKLFDEDGRPTPNLAHAMLNMASVEIGPFRVETSLVRRAVDLLSAARAQSGAAPEPSPGTKAE